MTDLTTYHAWNIAAVRFSAAPDALDAEQTARLQQEVTRAVNLEAQILTTPEAAAITVPQAQVDAAVAEWQSGHPLCPISDAVLAEALGRELQVQAVLETIAASVPDADAHAARQYYQSNPSRFQKPERRVVRHILITVNPDYPDNTETAAWTRANAVVLALKGGARFADLASQHSECPTAMQGGLVGTVAKGTLYPQVEATAFALGAGEWSGPVRTELGWHLVQCEEVLLEEVTPFAAVKSKILTALTDQARRTAQRNWLQQLSQDCPA